MALAAVAIGWNLASGVALVGTVVAAAVGSWVGQGLGRSRRRLAFVLPSFLLFDLLAWGLAALLTHTAAGARVMGPVGAITVVALLRLGSLAFSTAGALRALAARRATLVILELGLVATAVVGTFASHREGVISRPLWLSDAAWHAGFDPAIVLLGVGAVSAGLLAMLLLVESRSRRALSSLFVVAVLGLIAALTVNVTGAAPPSSITEIPATTSTHEVTVPPVDGGANPHGGTGDSGNQDSGKGDGGDGGEGGSDGGSDGSADGGGSDAASGEGGSDDGSADAPPPPPPPPDSPPSNNQKGEPPPPTPVAVVVLEDDDPSPPGHQYYFRQAALSQFNGTRLVPASRSDADRDVLLDFSPESVSVPDAIPAREREAGAAPPRVHVRQRIGLLIQHTAPIGLEAMTDYEPLPNPNRARFNRVYRATASTPTGDYTKLLGRGVGDPSWGADLRAYYTEGPQDPRYKQMALKMVSHLKPELRTDPFAKALAIQAALGHELSYSTAVKYEGADPTGDMLFGSKIGYCVHFAHAAVFLWRSVGIPARVAVGYAVEEDDRKGSSIVILGDRAHAWPEIYVTGVGWVDLDIAAEKNLDPPKKAPDEDFSRLMGDLLRDTPPDAEDTESPPSNIAKPLAETSLAGLGVFLLVLYAIKVWRRVTPSFAKADRLPRVAYRAAADVLAEQGFVREYGESPDQFAERVRGLTPSFEHLTALVQAARLRPQTVDSQSRPELSRATWQRELSSFRKEVATQRPFFKRLLGILNPLTLFSRFTSPASR